MKQKIISIIKEINPYEEFDEGTDLIEEGILDSLSVMILLSELERKFGIKVDMEKIEIENIKSVIEIEKYIDSLTQ